MQDNNPTQPTELQPQEEVQQPQEPQPQPAQFDVSKVFLNQTKSDYITEQNIFNGLRDEYQEVINKTKEQSKLIEQLMKRNEELEALKNQVNALSNASTSNIDIDALTREVTNKVQRSFDERMTLNRVQTELQTVANELATKYPTVSDEGFDKFISWTKQMYGDDFYVRTHPDVLKPTVNMIFDRYYETHLKPKDGSSHNLNLNQTASNTYTNQLSEQQQEQMYIDDRVKQEIIALGKAMGKSDEYLTKALEKKGLK